MTLLSILGYILLGILTLVGSIIFAPRVLAVIGIAMIFVLPIWLICVLISSLLS